MITLHEIERAYNEYSKEIFSYILRSFRDHNTAEDILQDVFIKLIHYSEKKEVHGGNLRALLYTIARSVIIDNARKSANRKTDTIDFGSMPDLQSGSEKNSDESIFETINCIIESMNDPERNIILLRQNGLTYQEISSITGIPERTLKRKVKGIIEKIRIKLQQEGFFITADTISKSESFND